MTEKKKTPRKKHPKKKRTIKKRQNTARKTRAVYEVDVTVPTPVQPSRKTSRIEGWKRFEAGYLYVTSLDLASIGDIKKDKRFKDIPLQRLHRWAKQDGWDEKRKAMFSQLQEGLEKKLRHTLEDAVVKDAQHNMALRNGAMRSLFNEDGEMIMEFRSAEGASKVVMETGRRLQELRELVYGDARAVVAEEAQILPRGPQTTTEYTREELEHAAADLLAKRRDDLRKELAESGNKPVKLVEG